MPVEAVTSPSERWMDGVEGFVVMTHNAGNGLATPSRLVATLRESGASIVGLQELTESQERAIERALTGVYPHQALFGGGIPGKGVLSVYPLHEVEQLHLYPGRPDLRATLRLDGARLSVIVAHPPPRNFRRGFSADAAVADQIAALIASAAAHPPAILLGDFNITRRSRHYGRLLDAGLIDAFGTRGRGSGTTLPARVLRLPFRPVARVDYIWHTVDLETLDGWVGRDSGSDHLPVLARLRLRPPLSTDAAVGGFTSGTGR